MTEEEILKLIETVKGNFDVIKFFSENLDLACRGWCTYVGLHAGDVPLHEDDLYSAASKFFNHREMPLPSRELFRDNIARRMPNFEDTDIGRTYYGSRQLSTIFYLSVPDKRNFYGMSKRRGVTKVTRAFMDQDYVSQLNERDQLWLSKFNDEYYKNRFRRDDTDFHHSPELKREVYANSNARNRDVYARCEADFKLVSGSDNYEAGRMTWNYADDHSVNSVEDSLIDYIDTAYGQVEIGAENE